jgi:hypothetical protein
MPNTYKVEAVDFDNRSGEGPEGIMFGFVYFNDERRVAYATGHGVTDGTGGWDEVTPTHIRVATEFLDSQVPGWNTVPE